jgi:fibronectin type 3 domain-containing protein
VYAVPPPSVQAGKPSSLASPGHAAGPKPLTDKPVTTTVFAEPVAFDAERCYVVRTVATRGTLQQESAPSQVACVTPKDIFPPAAPKGLTAVTSAGAISLLWEPNTEADLAGYLVLRGEAPGVTLQPITAAPVHETTYSDTTARAGVRYVYAVVAVDKSGNIGAQSTRVEETARTPHVALRTPHLAPRTSHLAQLEPYGQTLSTRRPRHATTGDRTRRTVPSAGR